MGLTPGVSMQFCSPLRYPGGKGKLANFLKNIFLHNNIIDGTYIEPYAGGASIAIFLLLHKIVQNIIINDLDFVIYAFWRTILDKPDWICSKIYNTNIDIKTWYLQREINKNPFKYDLYDVGFSTFFMNRTNRSGIISAGMIGGKNQSGKYKIDCRFNKINLINRIPSIAKFKEKISLYHTDALDLINNIVHLNYNTLIYFDPPYFNKSHTLYKNSYTSHDHDLIAKTVQSIPTPWIITYDNCDYIKNLYRKCRYVNLTINYSAYKNGLAGNELLFYNNLIIPYTCSSLS